MATENERRSDSLYSLTWGLYHLRNKLADKMTELGQVPLDDAYRNRIQAVRDGLADLDRILDDVEWLRCYIQWKRDPIAEMRDDRVLFLTDVGRFRFKTPYMADMFAIEGGFEIHIKELDISSYAYLPMPTGEVDFEQVRRTLTDGLVENLELAWDEYEHNHPKNLDDKGKRRRAWMVENVEVDG